MFCNSISSFNIYYFTKTTYLLKYNTNYLLNSFTITASGYLFYLTNSTTQKLLLLNSNFNEVNQTILESLTDCTLISLNNINYLISKNSQNMLNIKIFSSQADLVFNITLSHYVNKFFKAYENNGTIVITFSTQENNLKLLQLSNLTWVINETILYFNSQGTVAEIETTPSGHLILFGSITNNNTAIKNNYGGTDIFLCKLNI